MKSSINTRALLLAGVALIGFTVQADAQSSSSTNTLEEIVVTARRTEERLSDVPVAVSAIGFEALEERRILSEADLQFATPGLTVRQTNSSNQVNFSLRGQALDAFSFASPAVLNYVNEFNAQGVSASAFFDLDSVQVLKGPQGTLFGRNATGGAVLYQTRRPDEVAGGYLKIGYGNYDNRLAEGAVNVPLAEFAAFRVAAQYQERDGYQRNLLLGTRNASVDNVSVRPSLLLSSDNGFENLTVFQHASTGGVNAGLKGDVAYAPGQVNNGHVLSPGVPSGAIYAPGVQVVDPRVAQQGFNGLFDFLNDQKSHGFYDVFNNQSGKHDGMQNLFTNTTVYEVSDKLSLKNVFGYNRSHARNYIDVDGTPYEPLTIGFTPGTTAEGYTLIQRQWSDEIQASGQAFDDKLDFIAGAFYFSGLDRQRMGLCIGCDLTPAPLSVFLREYQVTTKSKAAYAQGTYHIDDRLNLTLGGRYTWENTRFTPDPKDVGALTGVKPATLKGDKPSWTVTVDYKLTDDTLIYLSHRGSWRTGGFNGTASEVVNGQNVVNSFRPETTYDFEAGMKFNGDIGNAPASLNIAVYDQHVKDVIRAVYLGVSAVSGNAKKARVTGFEADMTVKPTDWLQVGSTLAYADARYTNPIATVGGQSVTFGPYGDIPKWTGSAFFRATTELEGGLGELALRSDIYAQSKFYYTNAAGTILPGTDIAGYGLVDARLEWNEIGGSAVSLSAYAKNLTDKKYNVGGFGLGAVVGINAVLPGLPRMYGLEASVKF